MERDQCCKWIIFQVLTINLSIVYWYIITHSGSGCSHGVHDFGKYGSLSSLAKNSAFFTWAVHGRLEEHTASTVLHRDAAHSEMSLPRSSVTTTCIWDKANILWNVWVRVFWKSELEQLQTDKCWDWCAVGSHRIRLMHPENRLRPRHFLVTPYRGFHLFLCEGMLMLITSLFSIVYEIWCIYMFK